MMDSRELAAEVKAHALAAGADLVGIAPIESYDDYRAQVRERMAETDARHTDFMVAEDDVSFFDRLTSATNRLPSARAILVLVVYAYDQTAVYPRSRAEKRGKIARTYSHYPVVRQVGRERDCRLQSRGYQATHGQDVPLKYVSHRIGLGSYGKNGLLLTERFGSFIALRNVLTDAPLAPRSTSAPAFCEDCDPLPQSVSHWSAVRALQGRPAAAASIPSPAGRRRDRPESAPRCRIGSRAATSAKKSAR